MLITVCADRTAENETDDEKQKQSRFPGVDAMTSILRSAEEGRFIELATTCTQPAALGIDEAKALLMAFRFPFRS